MLLLFWIPILLRELNQSAFVAFQGLNVFLRSSCSPVGIRTRCAYRDAFGSDDGPAESPLTIVRTLTVRHGYGLVTTGLLFGLYLRSFLYP